MLFNSLIFLALVLVTLFLYYQPLLVRYQVFILITASAIFYGYAQPALLLLLLLSASVNAICSYAIYHKDSAIQRRVLAIAGVVFNLSVLAFFKYSGLLFSGFVSADDTTSLFAILVALPLPIGISFYTFQGVSLLVDVFTQRKHPQLEVDEHFGRHYLKSIFFIMFFPQLIAGPIVKAQHFLPQIKTKLFKSVDLYFVFKTLALGYFLKSAIADNLKDQTFWIAAPYFMYQSSLTLIVMVFGYSFQIFADFAGYSLIAIGIAALFGYQLPDNFNFPYISRSITEFWRRWHISLSSWLKEYLYIGLLGGNRIGRVRTYINLIIVMFLGGLWHGAALSYGVWGLWHGIGLALERLADRFKADKKSQQVREEFGIGPIDLLKMLWVFCFVTFGWLFFKLNNFSDVAAYLNAIVQNGQIAHNKAVLFNIAVYSLPVIIYHLIYLVKTHWLKTEQWMKVVEPGVYAVLVVFVLTNGGIPGEFVYFQF